MAAASAHAGAASGAPPPAARTGVDQDLKWLEVTSKGPDHLERQALILVPAHGPPEQRYPALLLLHGRGEVACRGERVDPLTAGLPQR